jgi:hypothetical protein
MTLLKKIAPTEEDIRIGEYIGCGFENFNPQSKDIIDTVSYEDVLQFFGKRFKAMLMEINATISRFKDAKWLNITHWDWDEPKNITVHSLIDDFDTVVKLLSTQRQLDKYDMDGIEAGSLFDSVGMNFFKVQPFSLEDNFSFSIGGYGKKSSTPIWLSGASFSMKMPEKYLWGTHTNPFDFSILEFVQMMDIMTFYFSSSWGNFKSNYPDALATTIPVPADQTYQVFPHRKASGWFTYVDAYVTKKQIPEAAAIYHLRAGGSLILATHQYLSIYNEQHIITANKIEIRLHQLGLLPPDSPYAEIPKIPLGISDGRVKPSQPQNEITVER